MSACAALQPPLYAHGFSLRKRSILRAFIGHSDIHFVHSARSLPAGARLLLWGDASPPLDCATGIQIVRVEDGFLRSVGLGADLVRPVSWVFDEQGIYFDASKPSALEHALQNAAFSVSELKRAAALKLRIVQTGLTKYNVAGAKWERPHWIKGPLVLVTGQVETDASIARGTVEITTNLGLLQAVRRARPSAYILYKPHPDVVAGLRSAGEGEDQAKRFCDEIVQDASTADLLQEVDEVHVLTSLTGFEALLRGKRVSCWGQPFYAGWGLTEDAHPHPRRTRRLALDELVAGALLRYPIYLSPTSGERCTAEQALNELLELRARRPAGIPLWRRLLRPLIARL